MLTQPHTSGLLTEKFLQSLTLSNDGQRITDRDSMYGIVRAGQKGVSVLFRWRFRFEGRHHDYTCGTWPGEKLSVIRQIRRDAESVLKTGKNPGDEKRATKLRTAVNQKSELLELASALLTGRTVEGAMREWFGSKSLTERKDGGLYARRALEKDVIPILGSVALTKLKRGVVMDVLHDVAKRAPVMANRTHALLSQFFEYCVGREWLDDNLLRGTKRESVGGSEPPRERILCHESDPDKHEFRELAIALKTAQLSDVAQSAIWLALGTACRIGELVQARWEQVDFDRREWHIPSDNTKNGHSHIVYLSDFSAAQFQRLYSLTGEQPWCFPGKDDKHLGVKTITKQIGDRQRKDEGLSRRTKHTKALMLSGGSWTPHDLRRTAATIMGQLGVAGEIIERCLNHSPQKKLERIYQRNVPREKMRQAWDILGVRLTQLLKKPIEPSQE
jgi:integrase